MKTEMEIKAPQTKYLADYTPPPFVISQVSLEFDIQADHTDISSQLEIRRHPQASSQSTDLVLDAENMEILRVTLDGSPLKQDHWAHRDACLTINQVPDSFTLEITNRILPHENKALEGLYKSADIFCTQCEPEGFRRITPFIDRSDVMARYRVKIVADKSSLPVLLSNGNLLEKGDLENGRHFAIWEDPFPKPSYLFALVAGNLGQVEDHFVTRSDKTIPLRIYVDKGNEERCHWAMESLKRAMKWDEDVFGLEYDLDTFNIVAVEAFNMGAMENKGLNIFNASAVLANPETATDANYENIEGIVAHEYFHNWTGNRVTCRDWFQLTLKEGLTVFRDQEFSADMNSRAVNRIDNVYGLREAQFVEDAGPNAHPIRPASYIEINNFYTATVYQKGAEVIRMVHTLIGPQNFRKGMDRYFELFDGQAVTCEDFLRAMSEASRFDFSQFMNWYNQAGTPHVTLSSTYNEKTQTYQLTVEQSCPSTPEAQNKNPFHFPLAIGLLDSQGQDLPLTQKNGSSTTTQVLEVKKSKETFVFEKIACPPIISANRNFSAPIHLKTDLSFEDEIFLFSHDSDPFNRFEAGQRLATRCLQEMIQNLQKQNTPSINQQLIEAFGAVLTNETLDHSFRARLFSLPSVTSLTEAMEVSDFESAHQARKQLTLALAQAHRDSLKSIYQQLHETSTYQINAQAFGRRQLKNMALGYLMRIADEDAQNICLEQFQQATNMTDEIAALNSFCHSQSPHRQNVLDNFYEKWHHESLVMNKWFVAQALADHPDVLNHVKALENNPVYDRQNPNKVRSLIGAFSQNLIYFHHASGQGYQFVAQKIIEIDQFNSLLAGRLSTAFKKYASLDLKRQALMKSELDKILKEPDISKDVYEIISKTLKNIKPKKSQQNQSN